VIEDFFIDFVLIKYILLNYRIGITLAYIMYNFTLNFFSVLDFQFSFFNGSSADRFLKTQQKNGLCFEGYRRSLMTSFNWKKLLFQERLLMLRSSF
jgi:hypothetical protein